MAWRDRLRRRATAPRVGGTPAGPGSAQPAAPGAMGTPASGAAGPTVPHDWDGGWRRTPPPTLTVARTPLGVSDGLAFRSGLASWQDPSFDAGLGHALLPSAPVGLVHGVTGPVAPRATHTAGGPLLLRVPRPQAEEAVETGPRAEEPGEARPDTAGPQQRSAAPVPQVSRRTRPGARPHDSGRRHDSGSRQRSGSDSPGSAGTAAADPSPIPRGTGSSDSAVATASGRVGQSGQAVPHSIQRSAETSPSRALVAADPLVTVAAPDTPVQRSAADPGRPASGLDLPVVRRIAVVPRSAADSPAPRPPSGPGTAPQTGRTAPDGQDTNGTTGHTARATPAPDVSAVPARVSGTTDSRSVRPRPLGPSLTVARRPGTPVRRIAVLRPDPAAVRPAAGPDVVPTTIAEATPNPVPPVQRTAGPARPDSRAPLGAPLSELPATARPLTTDGPEATSSTTGAHASAGPALPIVQRQASAPGIGARPGPHGADTARPQTRPEHQVQPRLDPHQATGTPRTAATVPEPSAARARARGGLGAPLSAMPPTADAAPPAGSGGAAGPATAGGAEALPRIQRTPVRPDRTVTDTPATATGAPTPSAPLLGATNTESGGGSPGSPVIQGLSVPAASTPDAPVTPPVTPLVTPAGPQSAPAPAVERGSVQRAVAPEPPAASTGGSATVAGTGGGRPEPVVVTRIASATDAVQRRAAPQTHPSPSPGRASTSREASAPAGPAEGGGVSAGGRTPARGAATAGNTGVSGPAPLVVARSVTAARPGPGTDGVDTTGVIQRRPLPAQGQRAAPRSLALLAARPLTVNTRASEGVAPSMGTRAAERPVVAASWRRAPDPVLSASAPSLVPGPEVPHIQRAAAGPVPSGSADPPSGTSGPARTRPTVPGVQPSPSVPRVVPVVRPAPSVQRATAGGDMAVRPLTLPLSDPQVPPLQDQPYAPAAVTPLVPVVRASRTAPTAPATTPPRASGPTGPAVQREAARAGGGAVSAGVPMTAVPPRGGQRSSSAPPVPGTAGAGRPGPVGARQEPVVDLDELARRLLDPLARLLRADLRRGRERAGRPYDGRR
ncbi:hypothetical protein ABT187_12250 [Streptomyces sp. NPDC001817]|uniref:hypothetical protein n=1 Tax=Streptomyces sp. NPDC001817 TaxID=3154398 RepID=UPI003329F1E0